MNVSKPTFAIADDLSSVIETKDGFGCFQTEIEATESLIDLLAEERDDLARKMAKSKRKMRALRTLEANPTGGKDA